MVRFLDQARVMLARADTMLGVGLNEDAGRTAEQSHLTVGAPVRHQVRSFVILGRNPRIANGILSRFLAG